MLCLAAEDEGGLDDAVAALRAAQSPPSAEQEASAVAIPDTQQQEAQPSKARSHQEAAVSAQSQQAVEAAFEVGCTALQLRLAAVDLSIC